MGERAVYRCSGSATSRHGTGDGDEVEVIPRPDPVYKAPFVLARPPSSAATKGRDGRVGGWWSIDSFNISVMTWSIPIAPSSSEEQRGWELITG